MNEEKERIIQQALAEVVKYRRCSAAMSVRTGKTRLALLHLQHHYKPGIKVLVVAPRVSIFESWKDEAVKWGLAYLLDCITFSTYVSLPKLTPGYDIIYLDEIHSILPSAEPFLDLHQGTILGLSGTMPKYHHSDKGKLVDKFAPIAFEYTTTEAVDAGIINDYRIIIHPIKLDTVKKNITGKGKFGVFYTTEKANYDYWCGRVNNPRSVKEQMITRVMRMKAMQGYPSKEIYAKNLLYSISDKCLLFVDEQVQADRCCTHSYHSDNPDSQKNLELFKEGKILKLSAVQQISQGVTIPGLKQVIIKHAYGNERQAHQRIARCLSLNPDETAIAHILMFSETIDSQWVNSALESFDKSKIEVFNPVVAL